MKTKSVSSHLNRGINNKGFSLMELIVVIAIMAVFVAVAIASSSILSTSNVKEVEQGIEDYVTMARTKSMSVSAKEWYMMVTVEDGDYVTKLCKTVEESVGETTELKTVEVDENDYNNSVTVTFKDGVSSWVIDEATPLCIYFDSATGKASKVTVAGTNASIANGIGRIEISDGSYDIVMKIFYNTGKCERE